MKKILVCGGRDFDNARLIYDVLSRQSNIIDNDITIIEGAARGVDTLAAYIAIYLGYKIEEYPADWDKYKNSAGSIRNKQMLDEGKPDLVIAFPGGRGTLNMKTQARSQNIPIIEIEDINNVGKIY